MSAQTSSPGLPSSKSNDSQPSSSCAVLASFRTLRAGSPPLPTVASPTDAPGASSSTDPPSPAPPPSPMPHSASAVIRPTSGSTTPPSFTILALFLATHHFSLLTFLSLAAAWLFLYAFRPSYQPLVLHGCSFSDRKSFTFLSLLTLLVVFLTSVGSLLISGILVGHSIAAFHGTFKDPEDLFLNEQDSLGSASGIFS